MGIHLVLTHDEAHFDVLRVYVVPGLDLAIVDANYKGPLDMGVHFCGDCRNEGLAVV